MIVWLSSYPKSGNTYLRALLSSYIFSEDGIFNFGLLKKFIQFPNKFIFEKLGLNISDDLELAKNYIKAQEFINQMDKKDSIHFVKTHSSCASIGKNKFTDIKNTLGVVYIVRDPRNVVTSYAHYFQKSHEEATNDITGELSIGVKSKTHPPTFVGSWKFHYNSWKQFNKYQRFLLIKYEDLIKNPEKNLLEILNFIFKLGNSKFQLDKKKFENTIKSTSFEQMQKLEKNHGFDEAATQKKTGDKIKFFNLGKENNWKSNLDETLIKKIEKSFETEMKELKYL